VIGPATPLKILDGHMRLLIAETAREVLERQLAVFGAQRVIFGSDSRHAAEGYRHWLLSGQRSILDALQVSEEDHGRVLGGGTWHTCSGCHGEPGPPSAPGGGGGAGRTQPPPRGVITP